jgi:hypothetical protein
MAFFFEDLMKSVSSGIPEATIFRWRQNAKALGVFHLAMIDVTTYQIGQYYNNPDGEIIFERFKNLEEVEKKYPDHKVVVFETPNTLDAKKIKYSYLPQFKHPKKAIYVVGPDTEPVDLTQNPLSKKFLVIPADFKNAIWAETAMAIALYDRYLKKLWP